VRKLIVSEFLTLDGVMEANEKWQFPYFSDDLAEFNKAQILALDTILLGRVTYEIFASSWPYRTHNEFGIADKLNGTPKFVVSSTLKKAEWNNSRLIKENVAQEVSKLKQQPGGDIGITGSATLIQSLMKEELIDEYRLFIHPIVVGSGKRLFHDGGSTTLKLTGTKMFSSGVVLLSYQPGSKEM
jgi:dihydrofolate reductase